jgi:signal transduction histidine kinase
LEFAGTAVELTVTNPAPALGALRSSGGHGLIGMRERATSLGGDFDAAGANGTFRVHTRIPYGGHRP